MGSRIEQNENDRKNEKDIKRVFEGETFLTRVKCLSQRFSYTANT